MESTLPKASTLEWTARIISMLFAAFISIFSLDVFSGEYKGLQLLTALFMHLIPTFLVILVIILSWKRNLIATFFFLALAIAYVVWAWGKFDIGAYLMIAGPMVILGLMHFFVWRQKQAN